MIPYPWRSSLTRASSMCSAAGERGRNLSKSLFILGCRYIGLRVILSSENPSMFLSSGKAGLVTGNLCTGCHKQLLPRSTSLESLRLKGLDKPHNRADGPSDRSTDVCSGFMKVSLAQTFPFTSPQPPVCQPTGLALENARVANRLIVKLGKEPRSLDNGRNVRDEDVRVLVDCSGSRCSAL